MFRRVVLRGTLPKSLSAAAFGEDALGCGHIGMSKARQNVHGPSGVGEGFGGFSLTHKGVRETVVIARNQVLAVDGFG